jgi:hypothetical protein
VFNRSKPFLLTATWPLLLDSRRFMEKRLKLRGWPGHKASSKARASSLVLLVLVAHALFVCVTHHHDRAHDRGALATISFTAEDGDSNNTPDSGSDSHCLSCRIQRTFQAAARSQSIVVELPLQAAVHEDLLSRPCLNRPNLILSSRAPPLA